MTSYLTQETDPDDDLIAWHEIQAETAMKHTQIEIFRRCPSDMPPCPVCEELYEEEDC